MLYDLPAPGDVIADRYVVRRKLAQGGMGVVYAVNHKVTGKLLALKCLLPERALDADIVARFVREAKAAGRLQHRHVVDVFDVGRDGPLAYLVMEYLEGRSLAKLLEDGNLSPLAVIAILVRAMEGVAAAHGQGIIHRDLKPDNIFVCVGSTGSLDDPRVLDFGISKFDDGAAALTSTGAPMGTPYYMCLEQMRGQRDLDVRVDVYAMGVVLYEAIAGRRPYHADSMSALAIALLTTTPPPLDALRADLPAGLSEIVMRAIARDRDDRHPSMRALIEALEPLLTEPDARRAPAPSSSHALDLGSVTTVSQQPTPTGIHAAQQWPRSEASPSARAPRAPRWTGRTLAGGIALAVAAGSALAAWSLSHRAPNTPTGSTASTAPTLALPKAQAVTRPAAAEPPSAIARAEEPTTGADASTAISPAPSQPPSEPDQVRARSAKPARPATSVALGSDAAASPAPPAPQPRIEEQGPVSGRAGEMRLKEF
jgi:eukaryotic-like serine/threonine-protein kinase